MVFTVAFWISTLIAWKRLKTYRDGFGSIAVIVAITVTGLLVASAHLNMLVSPKSVFLNFRASAGGATVETVAERWLYGTTLAKLPGTIDVATLSTGAYAVDWKVDGRDIKVTMSRHYHSFQGGNANGDAAVMLLQSKQ